MAHRVLAMISKIGKKNSAFSLLELVIVLGIMTMFLAISIPLFSKLTESAKLDTTARSVTSMLRTARARAIANPGSSWSWYVIFIHGAGSPDMYYMTSVDMASNPPLYITNANFYAIDRVYALPGNVSFNNIGFSKAGTSTTVRRATFRRTGYLDETSNNTSLEIIDTKGNKKTITVERTTGRVKIED